MDIKKKPSAFHLRHSAKNENVREWNTCGESDKKTSLCRQNTIIPSTLYNLENFDTQFTQYVNPHQDKCAISGSQGLVHGLPLKEKALAHLAPCSTAQLLYWNINEWLNKKPILHCPTAPLPHINLFDHLYLHYPVVRQPDFALLFPRNWTILSVNKTNIYGNQEQYFFSACKICKNFAKPTFSSSFVLCEN